MTHALHIDFVSDITCPWCAIGLSSLLLALENLRADVQPSIVLHPFELNPDMRAEGEVIVEYLGRKYHRTPAQIAETQAMIRERGAEVGFTFGERVRTYNTFDAHRLLHWARQQDKQLPLKLELLRAYHTDGKNPSDPEVLVAAAQSVGLDGESARDVLASGRYADEVREQERENQAVGISSVPAIIFNGKYLISGGQPVTAFEDAIRRVMELSASDAKA
ncbi:DsbA family oxidoreductase [Paracidovorax citrulli]